VDSWGRPGGGGKVVVTEVGVRSLGLVWGSTVENVGRGEETKAKSGGTEAGENMEGEEGGRNRVEVLWTGGEDRRGVGGRG